MKKAILGKKLGMTQIFDNNGLVVPVTAIEAGPCFVSQVKTMQNDGYQAVQLAFDNVREQLINKPMLGQFKKAELSSMRYLREFKLDDAENYKLGDKITCDVFAEGDIVDVTGTSKGHGFSGTIAKWNFHRHRMTHGNGPVHRHVGSIGANTFPAKVFKGKKMAGRWGNEKVTVQNLKVVKVDAERNLILVRGAIPGAKGSLVSIKSAVKVNA
ncbi:MAG TPA: 50S ribosomal protein L3 [Clostridiales bacterium]|nr:50S ribosomal protein L3 [Clostridiales bacterium]